MANGNNKRFLSDPLRFLTENEYYDVDFSGGHSPGSGVYDMDFVMNDFLYMKDYNNREHHYGAVPVHAYYLSAYANSVSTMNMGGAADYFFTPMISGCTFAVYGHDRKNILASHINDYDRKGLCTQTINGILGVNYNFCRILSKADDAAGIADPNVQTYNWDLQHRDPILVFGMRDVNGDWHFYKKLIGEGNPFTEM